MAVSNINGFVEFTKGRGQNNQIKSAVSEEFSDQNYESVETNTLDKLAEKFGFPSVIKIDTEGFNLQVLQEGHKVLSNKNLKALVLETFRDYNYIHKPKQLIKVEKLLAAYDFYPYFYEPLTRSLKAITEKEEGSQETIYIKINRENHVLIKKSTPIKLFGKYY